MHTDESLNILRQNHAAVSSLTDTANNLRNGILSELVHCWRCGETDLTPAEIYSNAISENLCTRKFAQFCRMCTGDDFDTQVITSLLPESTRIDVEADDLCIVYQRNIYSDRAFTAFSQYRGHASARSLPSFSAVCEEVYYGRCGYCILPIYSSQDGVLTSFTRMIEKYDLKIDMTCDLSVQDGDAILRFALLRRGLNIAVSEPCCVQINAIMPESVQIGAFLSACEETGACVMELVTLPLTYTNDIISYTIRFRISPHSLASLLMFLQAVLENYSLEGIFTMIEYN